MFKFKLNDLLSYINQMKESNPNIDFDKINLCIERIHDVYFNECNWKSKKREVKITDTMIDEHEYVDAFSSIFFKNDDVTGELVILAHY